MILLYRPELVAESNHGAKPLSLTLLLLCNLHKTSVQGKVSLIVSHVTLICYDMFALLLIRLNSS